MKAEEIRKMSDEDLAKKEAELREELGNLSFQHKLLPCESPTGAIKIRENPSESRRDGLLELKAMSREPVFGGILRDAYKHLVVLHIDIQRETFSTVGLQV